LLSQNCFIHLNVSGLRDLEVIVNYATMMGVKCDISIAPSLVFHPDYFRGMVCQLVRKKARGGQVRPRLPGLMFHPSFLLRKVHLVIYQSNLTKKASGNNVYRVTWWRRSNKEQLSV